MLRRATFLLLLVLSIAGQAQQLNRAKLDSLLDGLAANKKLMGSLTLARDGQVVYRRAFGARQVAPEIAATPATRYRIGSITKVFTAVLIMQLVDEKKLALNTPLARFFPQLPNARSITVDHLLRHRSGLHSFTSDAAYATYLTKPQTQAAMLARIGAAPPDFAPGARYEYSNSNFVVLGYIVEQLTKQPYAQALQQRIVRKVGLTSTYCGSRLAPARQEALSYNFRGSWQLSPETDLSIPGGSGAVVSTPTDLTQFLTALFGGRLVSAASLATMQTMRDGYGRGLMALPFGSRASFGHTGTMDGFRAMATYFPTGHLTLALCTNAQNYVLNDALEGIVAICFNQPYRIPTFAPSTYVPAPVDLARYAGTYASTQMPLVITLRTEGTHLRGQATGQPMVLRLEPVRAGVFQSEPAGIGIKFHPAKPGFTLHQGGGSFVFTKK